MSPCEDLRDDLAAALYDDLDPDRRTLVDRHLAECGDCAALAASLRATLDVMGQRRRPEPESDLWARLGRQLDARLAAERGGPLPAGRSRDAGGRRRPVRPLAVWYSVPTLGWQMAAVLALVAVGVVIGRLSLTPAAVERTAVGEPEPAVASSIAPEAAPLRARVDQYMQQSETLLLGIVNLDPAADGADALDLTPYRRVSERLMAQAPELQADLSGAGERRLAELVAELEIILRQIAMLEAQQDLDGVDVIRNGVDRDGLLFRIHLEKAARPARDGAAAPAPAPSPAPSAETDTESL